jgi:predicted secreted protein
MLKAPKERLNIVGTAAGGATSLYVETSSIWTYIDADATSDVTLTVKYNSSTDLSTKMTTGDAITVVVLIRNGTTARKISTLTVDSTLVSVKWMYGATPAGNASATDIYTFNIIKTASGWTAIGSCIKFGY